MAGKGGECKLTIVVICWSVREGKGAPVLHDPIASSSHRCHDERQAHYYNHLKRIK